MKFKVVLTDTGWATLRRCTDYLLNYVGGFGNSQAAISFLSDFTETAARLKNNAASHPILENSYFNQLGIRKIHFIRHKYKLLYHIKKQTAFIDYVLHDRQDIGLIRLD